jgi:DNA-binding transcriptional regulator YhcF (GntR family)
MRKPITEIIEKVKKLLEKEGEMSVRQMSIKTGSQWRTINKALETMKSLGVVKERLNKETERKERLFSLK